MNRKSEPTFPIILPRGEVQITLQAAIEYGNRKNAPLRTLPDAWYEQGVEDRMADYIKREREANGNRSGR